MAQVLSLLRCINPLLPLQSPSGRKRGATDRVVMFEGYSSTSKLAGSLRRSHRRKETAAHTAAPSVFYSGRGPPPHPSRRTLPPYSTTKSPTHMFIRVCGSEPASAGQSATRHTATADAVGTQTAPEPAASPARSPKAAIESLSRSSARAYNMVGAAVKRMPRKPQPFRAWRFESRIALLVNADSPVSTPLKHAPARPKPLAPQ